MMLVMMAYGSWEVAGPYGGAVYSPVQSRINEDELWALSGNSPAIVVHSTNSGLSWDIISSSIDTDKAYEILDAGNGNLVIVGNNRSWTSSNSGVTWSTKHIYGAQMCDAVVHPSNAGELYATGRAIISGGYKPAVMHSTNNGRSFTKVELPGSAAPARATGKAIAISRSNPSVVFVGGGCYLSGTGYVPFMALSTNGGSSFSKITVPVATNDYNFYAVAIHPTNPSIMLAGSYSNTYRTINSGISWTKVASNGSFALSYSRVNTEIVQSGRGKSIGYSTNGGKSWTTSTGASGENIDWVVPSWKSSSIAFSSSSVGFLRSTDGGVRWTVNNTGLNVGNITAMIESKGWLYAFMENCGIYRISLSDVKPDKWQLVKATGVCENLCDFACDDAGNILGLVGDG